MSERNFFAYQLDFYELQNQNGEETYSDFWNYTSFKEMMDEILGRAEVDRKKMFNGWFLLLDHLEEKIEKVKVVRNGKEVEEEHKYLTGRFLFAEFGYVGKLRHADTMKNRDNDKKTREGEENFVYFYIRASDGLLLLQGNMKVIRTKVEEYIQSLGEEYLENHSIHNFSVSTLLRGDFLDEIEKLDEVNKIEVELAVEKTSSYENELMLKAKQQAQEFEANYATIVLQSKYRKKGLNSFANFISDIKPKGTKAPLNGVNNIKVIGKQDGDFRRVYLSKISEKYPVKVKVDDKKNIEFEDLYTKIKDVGKKREPLRR